MFNFNTSNFNINNIQQIREIKELALAKKEFNIDIEQGKKLIKQEKQKLIKDVKEYKYKLETFSINEEILNLNVKLKQYRNIHYNNIKDFTNPLYQKLDNLILEKQQLKNEAVKQNIGEEDLNDKKINDQITKDLINRKKILKNFKKKLEEISEFFERQEETSSKINRNLNPKNDLKNDLETLNKKIILLKNSIIDNNIDIEDNNMSEKNLQNKINGIRKEINSLQTRDGEINLIKSTVQDLKQNIANIKNFSENVFYLETHEQKQNFLGTLKANKDKTNEEFFYVLRGKTENGVHWFRVKQIGNKLDFFDSKGVNMKKFHENLINLDDFEYKCNQESLQSSSKCCQMFAIKSIELERAKIFNSLSKRLTYTTTLSGGIDPIIREYWSERAIGEVAKDNKKSKFKIEERQSVIRQQLNNITEVCKSVNSLKYSSKENDTFDERAKTNLNLMSSCFEEIKIEKLEEEVLRKGFPMGYMYWQTVSALKDFEGEREQEKGNLKNK